MKTKMRAINRFAMANTWKQALSRNAMALPAVDVRNKVNTKKKNFATSS
jgi:hypothetical protein